ncbi:hypothetical protein [Microbacterium hydrocarbonoxydans]|uniref:hypothetical protein n=1 Tax=Microbacterium hydrocarbonoxydans TaxID=273678 RepID=UPI00203B0ED2|nr:hypothetical protein [Microbacterium hydrocarbonoxydans]MCM3779626.1 hypothetical protein [Microbacterium hydrocarbonoxydans]
MLHADEIEELRALQARAYGRGGALTDAEARRLMELESSRSSALDDHVHGAGGLAPDAEPEVAPELPVVTESGARGRTGDVSDFASDSPPEHSVSPVPARSGLGAAVRDHTKAAVAASAALLLIGVGAGWALFGAEGVESALTAGQQERRLELQADGEYDDGSVRLVAEDDDAVVWYATRDGSEETCVILDVGEASQEQCGPTDGIEDTALSVSVSVPVDDPDDPAEAYGTSVSAVLARATTGEPLAWVQRWEPQDSMLGQFDGPDRERAEELVDQGYLPSLSIVGYFHDQPVWVAEKPADGTQSGGMLRCMIVDATDEAAACQASQDSTAEIRALSVEEGADGTTVTWSLHVRFTNWMNPYLTIEQGLPADAAGASIELGGEYGDPILVEIPTEGEG